MPVLGEPKDHINYVGIDQSAIEASKAIQVNLLGRPGLDPILYSYAVSAINGLQFVNKYIDDFQVADTIDASKFHDTFIQYREIQQRFGRLDILSQVPLDSDMIDHLAHVDQVYNTYFAPILDYDTTRRIYMYLFDPKLTRFSYDGTSHSNMVFVVAKDNRETKNVIRHELIHQFFGDFLAGTHFEEGVTTFFDWLYKSEIYGDRSQSDGADLNFQKKYMRAPHSTTEAIGVESILLEYVKPFTYRFGQKFAISVVEHILRKGMRQGLGFDDAVRSYVHMCKFVADHNSEYQRRYKRKAFEKYLTDDALRYVGIDPDDEDFNITLFYHLNQTSNPSPEQLIESASRPVSPEKIVSSSTAKLSPIISLGTLHQTGKSMVDNSLRKGIEMCTANSKEAITMLYEFDQYLRVNPDMASRLDMRDYLNIQLFLSMVGSRGLVDIRQDLYFIRRSIHHLRSRENGGDGVSPLKLFIQTRNQKKSEETRSKVIRPSVRSILSQKQNLAIN